MPIKPKSKTLVFAVQGSFSWTVPANVSLVFLTGVGAGGGGGGGTLSYAGHGMGGGGSGEFVESFPVNVTPGVIVAVYVGAGGLGANQLGNIGEDGLDGEDCTFGGVHIAGGKGSILTTIFGSVRSVGGAGGGGLGAFYANDKQAGVMGSSNGYSLGGSSGGGGSQLSGGASNYGGPSLNGFAGGAYGSGTLPSGGGAASPIGNGGAGGTPESGAALETDTYGQTGGIGAGGGGSGSQNLLHTPRWLTKGGNGGDGWLMIEWVES